MSFRSSAIGLAKRAMPGRARIRLGAAAASALVAGAVLDRRLLAGDQLYVDLDLSEANLPPGSRLQVGSAVIEVTAMPHLGCAKFCARYGRDALRFVNSSAGKALRLRGLNARIVVGGTVRPGDILTKVVRASEARPVVAADLF